jgi:hypothetical protein
MSLLSFIMIIVVIMIMIILMMIVIVTSSANVTVHKKLCLSHRLLGISSYSVHQFTKQS